MGANHSRPVLKQRKSAATETQNDDNKASEQETIISNKDILDDTCLQNKDKSITSCNSFKQINNILSEYKLWVNKHQQSMSSPDDGYNYNNDQKLSGFYDKINAIYSNNISKLLDDFHHLLYCHSFDTIYNNLNIKCDSMNETEYIYLLRNYRDRSDTLDFIDNYNELYLYSNNIKEIVIQQIMDSMYSYYIHSYFLGIKQTPNEQKQCQLLSKNTNSINGNSKKIKFMKEIMLKKLKSVKSSDNFEQVNIDNKFITKIHSWHINNSSAQENLRYSTIKSNELYYDFGVKFYYWERHKNTQEFYINKKFNNLKDELTLNKICNVNLKDFSIIYEKANIFQNKLYTKQLLIANIKREWDCETYKILNNSIITLNHIIAMNIYCNFMNLHFKFIETYRPQRKSESNKSIIERHSHFGNLGQYLFEIIHIFGNKTNRKNIFYHSINDCSNTALSLTLCIKAPLSMTNSLQVIMSATSQLFECDGLILELSTKNNVNSLFNTPYFDCKIISDFTMENEYVMCGNDNYYTVQFTNIIQIKNGNDYSHWILLYNIITNVMSNTGINTKKYNKIIKQNVIKLIGNELNKSVLVKGQMDNQMDEKKEDIIINNMNKMNPYLDDELMKGIEEFTPYKNKKFEEKYKKHNKKHENNKMDGKIDKFDCFKDGILPNYINRMFHGYCINKTEIKINWIHLNDSFCYLFLNILLTFNYCDMIRLDRFNAIFPNCKEIQIFGGNKLQLNKNVMEYIYKYINENRKNKLKKLCINNVNNKQGSLVIYSIAHAAKKYKQQFNQINCKLYHENPTQYDETLVFEW